MAPHDYRPADATALFFLRLRFEAGSSQEMRAEVRMARDVSAGFDESSTVIDVEAAVTLLREWLLIRTLALPPAE